MSSHQTSSTSLHVATKFTPSSSSSSIPQRYHDPYSYYSKRRSIASTSSSSISLTSPNSTTAIYTNPRVQLVPHARTASYDGSLSPTDIELLANTNFDAKDMSSKDFDFEDVFTYDKPQRKLKSVVEVCSPSRDLSHFSFSHDPSTAALSRHRQGRSSRAPATTTTAAEKYLKNQYDARRR